MVKRYDTHTMKPNAWYVMYADYEKLEKENERLNNLCEEVEDRLLLGQFLEKRLERKIEELEKYNCINRCINRNRGICSDCYNEVEVEE